MPMQSEYCSSAKGLCGKSQGLAYNLKKLSAMLTLKWVGVFVVQLIYRWIWEATESVRERQLWTSRARNSAAATGTQLCERMHDEASGSGWREFRANRFGRGRNVKNVPQVKKVLTQFNFFVISLLNRSIIYYNS